MPAAAQIPADTVRAATTLALWAGALAGGASPDATLAALRRQAGAGGVRADDAEAAAASGLPGPGAPVADLIELLPSLRVGGPAQLVLPVPGDMRGLPAGSAAAGHALDAGAAVILPAIGVALIPRHGQWRGYRAPAAHEPHSERDMRMALDTALAEAAALLVRLDIASDHGDPRRAVAGAVADASVALPPGMPHSAASLLKTAITVEATLSVACGHGTAAVTAGQSGAVDAALAPLAEVAREARRAAVALAVAALHPATQASRARVPVSRPRGR